MKHFLFLIIMVLPYSSFSQDRMLDFPSPNRGCLACHQGIERIREHDSRMMREIYSKGKKEGDLNGCIVCHYGTPSEETSESLAHKDMIVRPGSVWVLDRTCGTCHDDHSYNIHRNLMQTEAGKIQGAIWGWGAPNGYKAIYGNYAIDDPDGNVPSWGSDDYIEYMHRLGEAYPTLFPDSLKELPQTDMSTIAEHPERAVYTYLRGECQRCHVGVRGKQRRGDYRGMGCAACHIPYSDEGYYEGDDESISKSEAGHLLVHSIQSSRKTKVTVNDVTYSGIPAEICGSCHNRGKRVGVSFLGMIESPYDTPWRQDGSGQLELHGKRYRYIKEDVHHRVESRKGNPTGGLLCQDCHTSLSVHGNGNLATATMAEIEVECADCHGTIESYPWELPLGFQDEYGLDPYTEPRGTTKELLDYQEEFSTVYDVEDGYLLSARGNPFGNVVRRGDDVIVHSASGLDFISPALKQLYQKNEFTHPVKAITAMYQVKEHMTTMECYTCHSTWVPQCYGCHVQVDYSEAVRSIDWIASGKRHFANGETSESTDAAVTMPGKAREGRTQVIWEDPVLGINGEGRVTPLTTGCQQITTVIGPDGNTLIANRIWNTEGGLENSGPEGQRGIDMTPAVPHTSTADARDCVSCHANPKTLGYGIGDGEFMTGYTKDRYIGVKSAEGENLSEKSQPQMTAIPNLPMDLSQVVTRDGKQLQTVGHHWPLSGPLTQKMREHMERVGVCISCHQDLPDGDAVLQMITTAGELLDMVPHSDEEHTRLLREDINWAARTRILAPVIALVLAGMLVMVLRQGKKLRQIAKK